MTVRKKVNKSHPTIQTAKSLSNKKWTERLQDESLLHNPQSENWRHQTIEKMHEYFSDPDKLVFEDWLWDFGIYPPTWDRWTKEHDDFKRAHINVKMQLASRRKNGAMRYALNYQPAYRDMHCYDYKWAQEVDKHHAELKEESNIIGDIVKELYFARKYRRPASDDPNFADYIQKQLKETKNEDR